MRRLPLLLVFALALPAFAQKEDLFGNGKLPTFREEPMDKKFMKSRVAKLLREGTEDRNCKELLGGLLTALGEIAPLMHKRDENFVLDPTLQQALQVQLSTPNFPAAAYLVAMVRRVMIDRRMPDEWLETAKAINPDVKIIDVGKLKMINEGLQLADSAYFTLPVLRNRYLVEVVGANSSVTTDVVGSFRDAYLDRDIVWPGAILLDAGLNRAKGKKKPKSTDGAELVAILEWQPPDPRKTEVDLLGKFPDHVDPVRVIAKLQPKQYLDLEKLFKGQRVVVKGKFWEMNKTATEVEVRDAVLFEDRDWSQGVILGNPNDIAQCAAAVNELTGLAPQQPGGFRH